MGATAEVQQRRKDIRQQFNDFIDMVMDKGKASTMKVGDFEEAGRRARQEREGGLGEFVFRHTGEHRAVSKDITSEGMNASLDLASSLERSRVDLQAWVREGRRREERRG